MDRKKVIIVSIMILMILMVCFIVIPKGKVEVEQEPEKIQGIANSIIVRDTITKFENSKKSVNVTMPMFQNLESGFESTINTKIYNDLNDVAVYNKSIEGLEENEIGKFTYEVTYERINSGKYISIVAQQYIHLGNGRPRIQKKCYVINAEKNTTAILEDVFANKTRYKAAVLKQINEQATNSGIELVGGNGLKELSDTQSFYIKDDKIVIYFEASEIAATAVGELEFIMPFEMTEEGFII